MALIMRSDSRRDFLYRTVQVGTGATLGTIAGCLGSGSNSNTGSSGNKKLEPIENVSFDGTEMNIEFTEEATGKTINLLPPNGGDPIRHWTVKGGKTSFSFSLVDSTNPISSGKYSIQMVKDSKVVSKQSIKLEPDISLVNINNNSKPPNLFEISIKLNNRGTLPANIDYVSIPSGVPDPTGEHELRLSRIDSNSTMIQNGIGINKTATFKLQGNPFRLRTDEKMRNYTTGNESPRKCVEKERQATLIVNTSQETALKKPFTYSLSGETRVGGTNYYCGDFSLNFSKNSSRTNSANKMFRILS